MTMNLSFFSWNQLPVRQKVALFMTGIISIALLGYLFVLQPQWQQIDTLQAEYKIEQQKVKIIEDFVLRHPSPEGYLAELDGKLVQMDAALPDNPEISSFLSQIESLSATCNVQLVSLKPGKIVDKENYRMYDIEIIIHGDFPESMNFINKIEKGLRFTNITATNMNLDKDGLVSKITAKIYTYGVPAPAKDKTAK